MNEEKNIYDLTVLLTQEDEEAVKSLVEKHKGEGIADARPFTKVNLAYPVKGNSQAFMAAIKFSMSPDSLSSLKEALKDEAPVLRYLVLKVDKAEVPGRKTRKAETPKRRTERKEDFISNKDLEEKIKELE